MNVRDLLCGMEDRAMDSQFLKDIRALYDAKDYEELQRIDGLQIYGTQANKCAILSFNIAGVHGYDLGMILDKLGIAVRTGQHCAEPVMTHYGVQGMCRASLALYTTEEEIAALVKGVKRAVAMLRG